jgi:hypothetical protein
MTVAPTTDSPRILRGRGPTPGDRVEVEVARAGERQAVAQMIETALELGRVREQLDQTERERDGMGAEAIRAERELEEVGRELADMTDQRDRALGEIAELEEQLRAVTDELADQRRERASLWVDLDDARSRIARLASLCGALLHRYLPRPERGPELHAAIASASQLGYWREELARAVVGAATNPEPVAGLGDEPRIPEESTHG